MFDSGIITALSTLPVDDDDQINWPPGRCNGGTDSNYLIIYPMENMGTQFNMNNTERRRSELFNLLSSIESSHQQNDTARPSCYLDDGAIELTLTDDTPMTKHVMTGGGKVGDFFKSLFKFRSFDSYVQQYEAARTKIGKKMIAYEAETARLKAISTEWSDALKKLFLNEKYKVMWTLMRDKTFDPNKNPKHDYKHKQLTQDIKRIEIEQDRLMKTIDRLRKSASEKMNLTFKIFGITIFTKKDFKIGNVMIVNNYIGKFKQRLEKDQELFLKIAEGFNDFTEEISKATELKAMYAIIGGKDTKELTSTHRKEAAMYMKNKEKYEKMLSFTESRRDELLQLIQRKEKMFQELDFYRDVLEFGGFDTIHGNIRTVLDKQWIPAMTALYSDLESAIDQCGKWKKVLEGIKSKVSVNGNQIGKLTAGKAEFTPVKREYEVQLENVTKVIDTQSDISATLAEIKNNFIKLVPDVNLLPDMFHVASAQGFVLEMMNHIKLRQEAMGKDLASATEAIKKKLVITGGGSGTARTKHVMTGGMLLNLFENGLFPTYLFNNAGHIWDSTADAYIDDATSAEVNNMTLYPVPLGVRVIEDDSIPNDSINDNVNEYFNDLYPNTFINAVYNIDSDVVSIVSYAYDSTTGDVVITGVNELATYVPYEYNEIVGPEFDNYYFYVPFDPANLSNKASAEYNIINQIRLTGSNLVILPVLYNIREQTMTMYMNEYILVSPFNGKPIMTVLADNDTLLHVHPGFDYDGTAIVYNNAPSYVTGSPGNGTAMNMRLCGISRVDHTLDIANDTISTFGPYPYYFNYCDADNTIVYGKDTPAKLAQDVAGSTGPIDYMTTGTDGNLYPIYGANSMNLPDKMATYGPNLDELPKQQEIETMILLTQYINKVFNRANNITFDSAGIVNNIEQYNTSKPASKILTAFVRVISPYSPHQQHIAFNRFNRHDLCALLGVDTHPKENLTFSAEILNVVMLAQITIAQLEHDTVISGNIDQTVYLTPNPMAFGMAPLGGAPGVIQPAFIADPSGSGLMIPNPATGTYNPILIPKPLHPSTVKALEYLKRIIDSSSPYWSNLKDILSDIEKFFSKDFLDYEQLLMKILDQMFEVREFEDKVLKIDIGKDKDVLPSYSYIYKNLEVKVDPSSKEGYSSAGKALYEKLKQNREYVKYNKATLDINPENIIYDLTDDLFMRILTGPPAPAFTTSFFSTGKGIKYKEYLKTREGAEALFKALSAHPTFGQGFNRAKIAHVLMLALTTYTSDPDVYNIYKTEADASISKNQPKKKDGKQDDKKKDPNKKSGTTSGGGAAATGGT